MGECVEFPKRICEYVKFQGRAAKKVGELIEATLRLGRAVGQMPTSASITQSRALGSIKRAERAVLLESCRLIETVSIAKDAAEYTHQEIQDTCKNGERFSYAIVEVDNGSRVEFDCMREGPFILVFDIRVWLRPRHMVARVSL